MKIDNFVAFYSLYSALRKLMELGYDKKDIKAFVSGSIRSIEIDKTKTIDELRKELDELAKGIAPIIFPKKEAV